jgi:hypothetical protein
MTTPGYSADPEHVRAALTRTAARSSDESDLAPETMNGDAAGSYGRTLAALIIAIADITSEPNPVPPSAG